MTSILKFKLFLLAVCLQFNIVAQTYVSENGTGDGSSWEAASGDLKSVLAAATEGTVIWVKNGDYFPSDCVNCSLSDRSQSFQLKQGVKLYGGFAGTESAIEQRALGNFPTVLNGDIGKTGNLSDNSFTILEIGNVDNSTILDGFEFKNGNADEPDGDSLGPGNSGGAIHVAANGASGNSSPKIVNCNFVNNRAIEYGGAIHVFAGFGGQASVLFENCFFNGNSATNSGGAIFQYSGFSGNLTGALKNCKFRENTADEGGAVFILSSADGNADILFDSSTFEYNWAGSTGGALKQFANGGTNVSTIQKCFFIDNSSGRGGAFYNDGRNDGNCSPTIKNTIFLDNESENGGAALYNLGYLGRSNPVIQDCIFETNFSDGSGGAVYNDGAEGECLPIYDRCRFLGNSTNNYGAALYNFGKTGLSSPIITNCLFRGNKADSGASVYSYGGDFGMAKPQIINCTFTKNEARVGPCVYNQAGSPTGTVAPFVSNCIFWDNIAYSGFGLVFQNGHADPTIQYSLIPFDDCGPLNTQPNSTLTCGPGIIFNQDPLFTDADNFNFRPLLGSPVIDAGIFTDTFFIDDFDLDKKARIVNGDFDMGAYEYFVSSDIFVSKEPIGGTFCEGDSTTLSVEVGGSDNGVIAFQWLKNDQVIPSATSAFLVLDPLIGSDQAIYKCEILNGTNTLYSDEVSIDVENKVIPLAQLVADKTEFCGSDSLVHVDLNLENQGFFNSFLWNLNGDTIDTENLSVALYVQEGDTLFARMTSSERCLAENETLSNVLTFSEQEMVTPTVSFTINDDFKCEGDVLLATSSGTSTGDNPIFNWYLNNEIFAENQPNLEIQSPSFGDQIYVELISNLDCASTNSVISDVYSIDFDSLITPTISFTINPDFQCEGDVLIATSSGVNTGTNPLINWYVNNELVAANLSDLELPNPGLGDEIYAELISDLECLTAPSVTSDTLSVEFDPTVFPSIDISFEMDSICLDSSTIFTAEISGGGADPSISWVLNGEEVALDALQYSETFMNEGEFELQAFLNSSETCVSMTSTASNTLDFKVYDCIINSILSITNSEIEVYPNPTNGLLYIDLLDDSFKCESIVIFNNLGQVMFEKSLDLEANIKLEFDFSSYNSGLYFIKFSSENGVSKQTTFTKI